MLTAPLMNSSPTSTPAHDATGLQAPPPPRSAKQSPSPKPPAPHPATRSDRPAEVCQTAGGTQVRSDLKDPRWPDRFTACPHETVNNHPRCSSRWRSARSSTFPTLSGFALTGQSAWLEGIVANIAELLARASRPRYVSGDASGLTSRGLQLLRPAVCPARAVNAVMSAITDEVTS